MFDRRTNDDTGACRTRESTFDQQQVIRNIYLNNLETLSRYTSIAHVTRHLLAFPDATRRLTLTDGARNSMRTRVTVRGILHVEIVALDGALEALALGGPGDINQLTGSKKLDRQLRTRRKLSDISRIGTELPKTFAGLSTSLGKVPRKGLGDARRLALASSDLNSTVAVSFWSLDLSHSIRSDFYHRNRYGQSSFSENAGHAALSTDQSNRHFINLIVYGAETRYGCLRITPCLPQSTSTRPQAC